MKTRRGLSVALALAFVGVAPLAAQQPQHQEGHDHRMAHHQGAPMPMDHGACAMTAASDVAEAQVSSPTAGRAVAPRRARRATGPSRLQATVAGRYEATTVRDGMHAYRNRVRRTTGPSRFPPAIVGWHTLSATDDAPEPARRPARRASGPSRFPRG